MRFGKPQNNIENSTVEITRVIDEWVDQDGVKHRKLSKEINNDNKPINLGSIKKPHDPSIINIKITIPKAVQKKDISDFFQGLFGD